MAEALAPYADERSGPVLARVRSGRRSQAPGPFHSLTPLDEGSRAKQSEATARTFASDAPPSVRPPSTDVGLARDAGSSSAGSGRVRAGIVVVLVATAVAVGTGIVALRGHRGDSGTIIADPSTSRPPGPVQVPSAMPTDSVVLAPESTASPPSSALEPEPVPTKAVPKAPLAATTAPPATAPPAPLPTQLGDLKLH
jgi:hypothetical protein